MALFLFDPDTFDDQNDPCLVDVKACKAASDIVSNVGSLFTELNKFESREAVTSLFYERAEDFVDVFFSESEANKAGIKIALSDEMVLCLLEKNKLPIACRALMILDTLIHHHCLVGGKKLIDCLNRIVKAGDKLYELCQRIITRHPDHAKAETVKDSISSFLNHESNLLMQVGDKQRFAKRIHLMYGDGKVRPSMMHDEAIDTTWRYYRKNVKCWSKYPLACINCGKFEEKEGRKHNQCSACMNALYCSRECQRSHWKQHKADCKAYSRCKKPKKR